MQLYEMLTDSSLQSAALSGSPDFPFETYYDRLEQYRSRCVAWHWHRAFQFSLVTAGPVLCQVGTQSFSLDTGDGLFVNSGVIHRFSAQCGGELADVLFAADFLAPSSSVIWQRYVLPVSASGLKCRVFYQKEPENRPLLAALSELYRQAQETQAPLRELRLHRLTTALWECFFPLTEAQLQEKAAPSERLLEERMRKMLGFIQREYANAVNLEQIAAAANVSVSEAMRCFRRSIQTTPGRYLAEYRLERAKELLLSTSATVVSVALDCGFRTAGYFCRVFKASTGQSPQDFRRAAAADKA